MIIFIYGDDGVRLKAKLLQLTTQFAIKFDQSGLNLANFPATPQQNFPTILQSITTSPFLSEKRMVIVHDLLDGLKKDDAITWAEGLAKTPSSTILVLVDNLASEKVEKHELFKRLKDVAEVHAYAEVKRQGQALYIWLVDEAKKQGGQLSLSVASDLAARVGDDAWQLQNELAKLVAYAKGSAITTTMLDQLVQSNSESNIFAFIDALSQRDAKNALRLLATERAAGSVDFYLLTMLARQIRILLQIRVLLEDEPGAAANIAKRLSLHPFVAGKAAAQAKHFSLPQLISLHKLLTKLDHSAKTGGLSASLAVDRLVAEMLAI
jgi:DNA polymerase-3 subunit delta